MPHPHRCHDRRFAHRPHGPDAPDFARHPRHRPRAGLRRFFAHGDLRLVILGLIAERPRHGYEIIKAIEERAGGAYAPSPGVVYPTLTLLEELGHIAPIAGDGGPRKPHALTEAGRAFLEQNRPALEALLVRMDAARAAAGAEAPPPPLLRAIENLRLALRLRLGRGRLEPAQVTAIAAALDAAAVAVEQV